MNVVDIYRDNGAHLLKNYSNTLPDFVKNAALLEPEDLEVLPDDSFAFVKAGERAFPLVDRGHVATSVIYFMDGVDSVPQEDVQKVARRLVDACTRFELDPPKPLVKLARMGTPSTARQPTVSPTESNLYQAIRHFVEKQAEYEPPRRREICLDIVKTAEDMGVAEVPVEVARYASNAWNPELSDELERRKYILKRAGLDEAIDIIEDFERAAFQSDPDEFAAALYEFDKEAGLVELYDTRLTDAYKATFGLPVEADVEAAVNDLRKFAASKLAASALSADLLEKLAADPLGTIDNVPEVHRNIILATYGEYRNNNGA